MICATCGAVATHGSVFVTTTSRTRGRSGDVTKTTVACAACERAYLRHCSETPAGTVVR